MKATVLSSIGAACLMAIASCTHTSRDELVTFNFAANYDAPDTEDPESVIDLKMALNPEVTDSTLIRELGLCGIIDDTYYIYSGNNIYPGGEMAFDASGKCLVSFDRSGAGPGEHSRVNSCWADASTKGWAVITLFDDIYNYTFDGKFVGKDSIMQMNYIYPRPDGWIGLNASAFKERPTTFYYFDNTWQLTDSIVTPHTNRSWPYEVQPGFVTTVAESVDLSLSTSSILYAHNDTVYDVTSPAEGIRPIAAINSEGKRRPADMNIMDASDGEYLYYYVYMTKNHAMLFSWNYNNRTVMQIYDRHDGKLLYSASDKFTDYEHVGVPFEYNSHKVILKPVNYTTDDRFFLSASSEVMSEITGDEDANPALFSIQIK